MPQQTQVDAFQDLTLEKVPPPLSTHDLSNRYASDVIFGCNGRKFSLSHLFEACTHASKSASRVLSTNRKNHRGSEFGKSIALAAVACAMSVAVAAVVDVRIPTEIADGIISRVTVGEMTCLHTFRTRADERLKHKASNPSHMSIYADHKIAPAFVSRAQSPPRCAENGYSPLASDANASRVNAGPTTPYRAIGSSLVAGQSWNVAVTNGRIELRHGEPPNRFVVNRAG